MTTSLVKTNSLYFVHSAAQIDTNCAKPSNKITYKLVQNSTWWVFDIFWWAKGSELVCLSGVGAGASQGPRHWGGRGGHGPPNNSEPRPKPALATPSLRPHQITKKFFGPLNNFSMARPLLQFASRLRAASAAAILPVSDG